MKKFKYLILGVIAFCMFCIINVKAYTPDIVISGNSVFRKSATEASVNFISNKSGDIYYLVNANPSASKEEIILGEKIEDITGNVTIKIDIPSELLSSGAKYVHIIVEDDLGKFSNILTITMPKDVYYFDDFEAYNIDSYPEFFAIASGANGGNPANQKIINSNGNKVFQAYGTYGTGLDERIQINSLSSGYAILEADISPSVLANRVFFGGLTLGQNSELNRQIIVQIEPRSKKFCGMNNCSDITLDVNNNPYHVKIVVDIAQDKFDYYINGIKANSIPINASAFTELTWFGIYNGEGTVNYDNIKFYTVATQIYSVNKGTETNGNTFRIDKDEAEKDEIITITPEPSAGYRVKSVKINNNESGVINNITNYTFTMPDENVVVDVEFEKIPYTITVNSVTGATITPNGTTNVEYGDNQDIEITANTGYRLTSVKVNNVEQLPLTNDKITISNITEDKTVVVTVEKIPYTIVVNSVTGATITPNGTISVEYGDNQDIEITANTGYRLTSVKVNNVEKLPLTNDKITISNIMEDKTVVVTVEKIEYEVTTGSGQKHIIEEEGNAVFRIDADKSLFDKLYLNNDELDSVFYTITEGSTIITLKQDFLNNLLPGTYNLKATFSDGGEANTTFAIALPAEYNPQTGDSIMASIIILSISLIGLLCAGFYRKNFN